MLSLSKHGGQGLCARVFDRLRLTVPLLSFHIQSSPDLNIRQNKRKMAGVQFLKV
jgi:hypothetical protein